MAKSIWITGDTHGDMTRFSSEIFSEQKEMDKSDVVIICGDFGGVWNWKGETKEERYWMDWLSNKPFTTCFVDGNHECFPRLSALAEEERYGAPCGIVRDSVLWLKRGYVYTINDKKIFTFGGAASHDISDGILDGNDPNWRQKAKRMEKQGKHLFRTEGINWWKEGIEQDPSVYARGLASLAAVNNSVDMIVTHCAATSTQAVLGMMQKDRMTDYLQTIHDTVSFQYWFFGHYHMNRTALPHEYCLYEQIVRAA